MRFYKGKQYIVSSHQYLCTYEWKLTVLKTFIDNNGDEFVYVISDGDGEIITCEASKLLGFDIREIEMDLTIIGL